MGKATVVAFMRERIFVKLAVPKVMVGPRKAFRHNCLTCIRLVLRWQCWHSPILRFKGRIVVLFSPLHQALFSQKMELRVIVLPVLPFMKMVTYHLKMLCQGWCELGVFCVTCNIYTYKDVPCLYPSCEWRFCLFRLWGQHHVWLPRLVVDCQGVDHVSLLPLQ